MDAIIAAKPTDPAADTSPQESRINHLVYQLCNLNPQEIAAVEKLK